MKLKVLIACLAVCGLSAAAFANEGVPAEQKLEQKLERKAKREARIEKRFAMMDANKDGVVTLAEMKAAKHGKRMHGKHHRRGGFAKQK